MSLEAQGLDADDSSQEGPRRESEQENQLVESGPEEGDHQQGQEEPGHDLDQLADTHDHIVEDATAVAGQQPEPDPDDGRQSHHREHDHHRGAGPVDDVGEQVPSQVVRAQQVVTGGWGQ